MGSRSDNWCLSLSFGQRKSDVAHHRTHMWKDISICALETSP
jgi:hypothetical protein